MREAYKKFLFLSDAVKTKEAITYGVNEIEPELLDLLNFINKNTQIRFLISDFMVDILNGKLIYPLEIVIFTMRELQWDEIKQAAICVRENTDDWRIISAMNSVLAVYEDKWEDADFYQYYSQGKDS